MCSVEAQVPLEPIVVVAVKMRHPEQRGNVFD